MIATFVSVVVWGGAQTSASEFHVVVLVLNLKGFLLLRVAAMSDRTFAHEFAGVLLYFGAQVAELGGFLVEAVVLVLEALGPFHIEFDVVFAEGQFVLEVDLFQSAQARHVPLHVERPVHVVVLLLRRPSHIQRPPIRPGVASQQHARLLLIFVEMSLRRGLEKRFEDHQTIVICL
eukprot:CAMPEP_0116926088 /NCGR_PEP_ID=MMETSP0467-20121206/24511_1 /TAXON_ID=283647 /ORGANISM="Mesodinium pulex, Strain SPMC105" /LENGTH=175 /DNA_ID=CAMNT_0004605267 /DNA_START=537 /DNA_END=1064 /DNA_ORIENTATION=-